MAHQDVFNAVKISRILHAGYVFDTGKHKILFDPILENPFSRNCYAFPSVKFDIETIKELKVDAIFISHFHDDHCSLESLRHFHRSTPIYMYCLHENLFSLIRDLGFKTVVPLRLEQAIDIGDFRVTAKRALDEEVDSIFHIAVNGLNILNVVDSWIDYDMLDELKKTSWDLILWPFQTMREIEILSPRRFSKASQQLPPEWIEQLQHLKPKYLIPSSCQFIHEDWSWLKHQYFPISYDGFETQMSIEVSTAKIIRLNPSRSILLTKEGATAAENLSWVSIVGEENVDYAYNPDLPIPATSTIARNFVTTQEMTDRVHLFCETEIVCSYTRSEEEYFSVPRVWQLSTYDSNGVPSEFFYLLEEDKMQCLPVQSNIHWKTEIPIARLYGALESGESLTSMYVRINDVVFDERVERELKDADILQDPLLRCLFQKSAISYQQAQFERLKKPDVTAG